MKTPVCDFVAAYEQSGAARLHMPGHKGKGPLGCEGRDITEIAGADSLYEAGGVIAQSEQNAAALFGAKATFYSAGGSSQCIGAMLCLALQKSKSRVVLAARNAHKSFLHAAALLDADVRWLWPRPYSLLACPVTPEMLENALAALPEAPAAVYITSPDYLGNVQPVAALAKVCHAHGAPLLVDNAHGAYLHFLPAPAHPLDEGADLCCDSAHKTLPVLTGGACLHLGHGLLKAEEGEVRAALSLFGSTSPSYLILQSLDACNLYLADEARPKLAACVRAVEALKADLAAQGWAVAESEPLKVTLHASKRGWRGDALADFLRKNGVECEYADPDDLVLMVSPQNSPEDLEKVRAALAAAGQGSEAPQTPPQMARPRQAMGIRAALLAPAEEVPVAEAAGRVCAAPTVGCPPAVPVVVSGEEISPDAAAVFRYYGIETVRAVRE
ncbi:aminotransferase class V-fold PLP-dependent enzyme [Allofournierella sp.]|uniref:aminotransferase class V-fold PLP-dependent enzyme n=1 Tax=Allofournierella sp. TaxID=1940256 RepID=UPI002E78219C|nr:aminotransferase class V-fold PLP-dependent enzyme [Fournierella sp.]MEE0755784.1 aminotransferase class V-fold PLP-dependent enzyme [Fournierella sp.]